MTTHSFFHVPLLPIPVIKITITVASDDEALRRGDISFHGGIEEILMLVFTDRFVHFKIQEVDGCALLA